MVRTIVSGLVAALVAGAAGAESPEELASPDAAPLSTGRNPLLLGDELVQRATFDPRTLAMPTAFELRAPNLGNPLKESLNGIRHVELSHVESTWKGATVAARSTLFLSAVAQNYGWWDGKTSAWVAGGAAALGALYGGTLGYEKESWRIEARFEEE